MAEAVIMPRQGQSVESCLVTSVNKKKGDSVNAGEVLFAYETDKSSFEEEAKISGTVLEILVEAGEEVPCLEPVMIIGQAGEDISGLLAGIGGTASAPAVAPIAEASVGAVVKPPEAAPAEFIKISPRARAYAESARIDLGMVSASGPNGRIIERDIIEAAKGRADGAPVMPADVGSPPAAAPAAERDMPVSRVAISVADSSPEAEYTDEKLPNIRRIIAKAMHASLSEMAQLTLNSSFDAAQVLNFRARLKSRAQDLGLENITLNDIILYAVARTLKNHKEVNAHYLGESMRYFSAVNLGMAVDTGRGLVVPTIFGADRLSLNELSKQAKLIISEAQSGKIDPDKLKGGTFTVTNLGALGVESFTPVINPPQTAILGVNNITRRAKQVNGQDIFYDCMGLSLTFDHRALDGAPAARFLKDLCAGLENFDLLLAK